MYVTETLEEIHFENIVQKSTGKPVAKARPRQTSNSTLSPVSIPYRERNVEPGTFDHNCLEVSNLMIRLLRHDDSVNREEDGAVKFEDRASMFRSKITSSSYRSIRTWLSFLQRGGGVKKRFQYCVHFTCCMHKESGIREVRRRITQQSVSISKITAKSRTQAAFASWTSGFFQC